MERGRVWSVCLLAAGALLVVFGVALLVVFPLVINGGVRSLVALRQNADGSLGSTAQKWADPSFEVAMQFWLFNVTNPDEVVVRGDKPSLHQVGPYGFREQQHKNVSEFSDDGLSVSYRNIKTYTFDASLSCATCRADDLVTIPNIISVAIAKLLASKIGDAESTLEKLLVGGLLALLEHPFTSQKVVEVLYDGYSDEILTLLHNPAFAPFVKKLAGEFPDKVAFFYKQNGSDDGAYRVRTGVSDPLNIGRVIQWRNYTNADGGLPASWWRSPAARLINGTDGTLYPPFLTRQDELRIFVSQLCRSLFLRYKEDMEHEGIPGLRFTVPAEAFDAKLPENDGFCIPTDTKYFPSMKPGSCLPSGLLNVSACQKGHPPIVVSSPHFLNAPKEVVDSVIGLSPQQSLHETVVELEPTTGLGLRFLRRLQINVAIERQPKISTLSQMRNSVVPVLWLQESAQMDAATAAELRSRLLVPRRVAGILGYALVGVGLLLVVVVGLGCVVLGYQSKRLKCPDDATNGTTTVRVLESGETADADASYIPI